MFGLSKNERTYKRLVNQVDTLQKQLDAGTRYDGLYDPLTSRGDDTVDKVGRIRGNTTIISESVALSYYIGNGFAQNIADIPAEDATREGITIETDLDETKGVNELIYERMEELKIQSKMEDLVRYSRIYPKGSMLYYAVSGGDELQTDEMLKEPLPDKFKRIEFINVNDRMQNVKFRNQNQTDWTKENYNVFTLFTKGNEIHPSRYSWLVNSWIPEKQSGLSVMQTIREAMIAQANSLWSVATIMNTLAINIFKSDEIAMLDITQKAELLTKIKHLLITHSTMLLKNDESYEQLSFNADGVKEMYDFIFDNLGGVSRMPKNILLGKAHGVVTAGEYDTLNHYANISRFQELKLRPIYDKIIKLIIRESEGATYKAIGGQKDFTYSFTFNTLWKLDPLSESDTNLKNSQRDEIDYNIGKVSSFELRELDERYKHLDPFTTERPPEPPEQNIPDGDQ
jgi:phage-related protein (TIGR01555 family)